jgi:hypothetical protein
MSLGHEVAALFVLAMPVASIAWTVTHEEVLREPREWCTARSKGSPSWLARKMFYIVSCEYCFSHWVALAVLILTRYTLLFAGWRGFLVAGFSLVWISNLYMSFFARLRLEIREERIEIEKATEASVGYGNETR